MKARDVIRTDSNCEFWDVPQSDKMINRYRVYGRRMVYEVIEPSSVTGRHQTIMFLSDGQTDECYGAMSTRRPDDVLSGGEVYRTWLKGLYLHCYWTMLDILGVDILLDPNAGVDMGRIEILDAN